MDYKSDTSMKSNRSKFAIYLVGLAMLTGAAFPLMLPAPVPVRPIASIEGMIPESFGEWKLDQSIDQILPSPDVKANLDEVYDQIVSRTYLNGRGERIMLTIGYAAIQGGKQKSHWQEVCYSAQGFKIYDLTRTSALISGRELPVTRMLAVQGPRVEPVTYWITLGDRVVKDRADRLMYLALNTLQGKISDGMLVRISNIDSDPERAYQAHQMFANAMLQNLSGENKAVLIGAD
jgi:EpsI family protein